MRLAQQRGTGDPEATQSTAGMETLRAADDARVYHAHVQIKHVLTPQPQWDRMHLAPTALFVDDTGRSEFPRPLLSGPAHGS